ncbi:hypothetical protein Tco_0374637 [Tanacetum coccineum]
MEEGRSNGNKLKTELKKIHTQIIKLQKKQLGQKDKIAFAHYRISDLEQNIEKIQARYDLKTYIRSSRNLPSYAQITVDTIARKLVKYSSMITQKYEGKCLLPRRPHTLEDANQHCPEVNGSDIKAVICARS